MAERRANGEGSINMRRDKNGEPIQNKWVAQLEVHGKRKTFTGKTRKEAVAKLEKFKRKLEEPEPKPVSQIRYADFLNEWLTTVKRRRLKDTSYDRLECTINTCIIPYIGKYKLSELTYNIIQNKVINCLQDDGKAYSTVKKAYIALNESMRYAIFPMELIERNPMMGVFMPSTEQFEIKEIRYFSAGEIVRFKAAALERWGTGTPIYPLGYGLILMLNTGVRAGEALAWRWSDYDEASGLIHVKGTLAKVRDRTRGEHVWKMQFQSPKTQKGRRCIPVNQAAKHALTELKKERYFGESSPILAQADGSFNTKDNFSRTFEAVVKRAGIAPCGIHTLRHTFATQLIAHETDVKTVSSTLGHSTVGITYNIYVHELEEMTVKAMNMLCDL